MTFECLECGYCLDRVDVGDDSRPECPNCLEFGSLQILMTLVLPDDLGPLSLLEAVRAVLTDRAPSVDDARLEDLRRAVALVDAYAAAADRVGLAADGDDRVDGSWL